MIYKNTAYLFAFMLIIVSALTRIIPHPFNFTAIGAMALFSGAVIKDKRTAYLFPIFVLFLTDLALGFHASMIPVYGCFCITVFIGTRIKNTSAVLPIVFSSLISSVIFYLVTNLPFWYADISLYPMTWAGTMESYKMALPFFRNQVLGDLVYNAVLFGAYYFIARGSRSPVAQYSAEKKY